MEDNRTFVRVKAKQFFTLKKKQGPTFRAEIGNICLGGALLIPSEPVEAREGDELCFSVMWENDVTESIIQGKARLLRIEEEGFAVYFLDVPASDYARLRRLIELNCWDAEEIEKKWVHLFQPVG